MIVSGSALSPAKNKDSNLLKSYLEKNLPSGSSFLIALNAGEAFKSITIDSGSIMAYNCVVKGEKPSPFVGLLDDYSDAVAAYSLRKLRADYAGSAIQVRIDTATNPQPTYDIGFDSDGNLDTADLLSKAGSDDAHVSVWYDQSGGGNDATQGSASAQPQIVNSGSINLQNGEPCAVFDGVDDFLTLGVGNSLDYSENNIYSFSVNKNNGSVNGRIWADDIIGTQGYIINRPYLGVNGVFINDGDGYESASNTPATSGVNSLSTLAFNGTTGIAISRQNGVQYESKTVSNWAGTIGSSGSAGFAIGSGADGGQYFDGNQQSLIIYTSNEASNLSGIETNINKHYNLYWDGSQAGLLDDYPNASAAYSLRALNSAYTGAAIQVRKTVDNTTSTLDIGLLYDGSLDTDSLLSFAGSNNVFVYKWYDQSGNGINATQTSAARQPIIVSNGVVNELNERPSIKFLAPFLTDLNLSQYPFTSGGSATEKSIFAVAENDSTVNQNLYNIADARDIYALTYNRSGNNTYGFVGANYGTIGGNITGQNIISSLAISPSSKTFNNTVEGVSSNLARSNFHEKSIGSRGSYFAMDGNIQEMIMYESNQSANRTGIETNINNFYNVY